MAQPERLERRTRAFKGLGAVAGPFVDRARKLEAEYGARSSASSTTTTC